MTFKPVAVAIVLVAVVGCGDRRIDIGTPYNVTGTVKFSDGTPLSNVQLYFVPTKGTAPAYGKVADGGAFTLTTSGAKTGACAGTYMVYVRALGDATGPAAASGAATLRKVPESYKEDSNKSPLEVEITGEATLNLTINLK
jgi:hypothetical protein